MENTAEIAKTVATTATAAKQVDSATTETTENTTEDTIVHSKGVQNRIDKLTRQLRETERDRDFWRQMAVQQNSRRDLKSQRRKS